MSITAILFVEFVLAVAIALLALLRTALSPRTWAVLAVGLALWLAYVGALSWAGVVRDPALRPPGIVCVVGPGGLFIAFAVMRSRLAGAVARALPLGVVIVFQTYRVGVELVLDQLWREGLVPRVLTFEGANVDIWIGASAPLVAWIATRGRAGERVALVWNVLGLLALANVVVRSALTAPGALHLLNAEVPNLAIGTFPYTFIAGFLAPLAVTLHILALRALAARLAIPITPKRLAT